MSESVRFSTLVKICGQPMMAYDYQGDYEEANREGRVITIYDYGYGVVGHHIVDVSCRYVFPKPIPEKYHNLKIIGVG
jgi:alpha-D-ribose 1-methylphosphonate 5-phosphate C-P lyase